MGSHRSRRRIRAVAAVASERVKCSETTQLPDLIEKMPYSWAQGFMTRINMGMTIQTHKIKNLRAMNTAEQMRFLRGWCSQHPGEDYQMAVFALFDLMPVEPYTGSNN
jgi:hypothetical protein